MSGKTKIEWCDVTWNPIRGCSKVSKGCRNCYAERMAARFGKKGRIAAVHGDNRIPGIYAGVIDNSKWNGRIEFVEKHLADPLHWRKPRRIFVNSMSDLFHPNVPDEWVDRIFAVMALTPHHTFQILTKRPERMRDYLTSSRRNIPVYNAATLIVGGDFSKFHGNMARTRSSGGTWWPLPNVWLGVSVENQETTNERIPLLLQTPAAIRFISCEPLLGMVDLVSTKGGTLWIGAQRGCGGKHHGIGTPECPRELHHHHDERCGYGLDWVIAGGESGPGARPMHPDWARSLRDQCRSTGVPFFFKQWGEWITLSTDSPCLRVDGKETFARVDGKEYCGKRLYFFGDGEFFAVRKGKTASGCLLDGREWKEIPG